MASNNAANIRSVECSNDNGESASGLIFERDAALGFLVLNDHDFSSYRKADNWSMAIVIPIVIVLAMAALVFLYGFLTLLGPRGC